MKKNVYMTPATKHVGAEAENLMVTSVDFYLPSEGEDGAKNKNNIFPKFTINNVYFLIIL